MSDTLLDGTAVGDIVLVSCGNIEYGKVLKINNNCSPNVSVQIFGSSFTSVVYGTFVQKLTEEVVAQRRQQLSAELQELEAAWEIAKQRNT